MLTRRAASCACSPSAPRSGSTDTGASEPEVIRARLSERLHEEGELDRLVERAVERFGFRR